MPLGKKFEIPKKLERHHGYYVVVMIMGWLVPPIAVLMRFGICKDFFINIVFTIMGYIPGHAHNFYLQNVRKNHGRNRTPKWAIRYGLVPDHDAELAKKRAWAHSFNERTQTNQYDQDEQAEEDEWGNPVPRRKYSSSSSSAQVRPLGLDPAHDNDRADPNANLRARDLERWDSRDSSVSSLASPERSRKGGRKLGKTGRKNSGASSEVSYYGTGYGQDGDAFGDSVPGMGDRRARSQKKKSGLRSLVTGSRPREEMAAHDRFTRMELERQRAYGDEQGAVESTEASSKRTNSDPLHHEF